MLIPYNPTAVGTSPTYWRPYSTLPQTATHLPSQPLPSRSAPSTLIPRYLALPLPRSPRWLTLISNRPRALPLILAVQPLTLFCSLLSAPPMRPRSWLALLSASPGTRRMPPERMPATPARTTTATTAAPTTSSWDRPRRDSSPDPDRPPSSLRRADNARLQEIVIAQKKLQSLVAQLQLSQARHAAHVAVDALVELPVHEEATYHAVLHASVQRRRVPPLILPLTL